MASDMEIATKRFREDWPTIKEENSDRARAVRTLAELYMKHQDHPTFALLIAAHTAWREQHQGERLNLKDLQNWTDEDSDRCDALRERDSA